MIRTTILFALLVAAATRGDDDERQSRIVGGVEVRVGEYPEQLSLQAYGYHICGATVLSEYWGMTAAHCVVGYPSSQLTVLAGTLNLNLYGTRHQVAQTVSHIEYDAEKSWINNIAVFRILTPFSIDGVKIRAASLPFQGQDPATGSKATVVGWGTTSEGGVSSSLLLKADVAIVSQVVCNEVYSAKDKPVYSSQICAGLEEGNKGTCAGDSGGPLFVDGKVVGISSWALGCARPKFPGVLTRVSSYRSWINQKTGI